MRAFRKAALDRCLILARSRTQAHEQVLLRWRQDEDAEHAGVTRAHLLGTLDIDVEHDHATCSERGEHGCARCAVPRAPEDLRVLKELVCVDHPLEARLIDEVIVAPIDFAGTCGARGCRHAELAAKPAHHFMHDGCLADAGRSAHDKQETWRRLFHRVSVGSVFSVMLHESCPFFPVHGGGCRTRSPAESGASMSRDDVRRDRLEQFVDLARIYRRWTKQQVAQALGREPSKMVPESGNPKLDLVIGLADVLDWDVGDVAEGVWREDPEEKAQIEMLAQRGFFALDREAIEAHRAGDYRRMTTLARALTLAAQTGVERATACNRLAGAQDGLGRYTKALTALQQGLAEPAVPPHVRMMLEVNLANAHYALWHLIESHAVASGLVDRWITDEPRSRVERVVHAFGHYVRGHSRRRMMESDPQGANTHAKAAHADLLRAQALYDDLAVEFDDPSYAGVANTCRGAVMECAAALGTMDTHTAIEALMQGLEQVVDVTAYPPGDWLESYGWWAVFGCNIALRGSSGPELHRAMAVFSNKASEIAERLENWSMRERAFTFEHLRRQRQFEAIGSADHWLLDDEDIRIVAGTMGRFPAFRETGWRILESARALESA